MQIHIDSDALARLATRRERDLFADDVLRSDAELHEHIRGRRVLAIGGAGSIGSATVRLFGAYQPATVHVVDQNENNLTELVRDLRSGGGFDVPDFRALPLDYGAPVMSSLLRDEAPYDFILNFAALKHVRSEKDAYSLTQMLDTNLGKHARFLKWMADSGQAGRYFCVSTDKAANPVNLMGASKRLMEHLAFSNGWRTESAPDVTSARFANVAFSDGSLLDGFLKRLQKRQPLAVPRDTKRYFVSLREAGQICVLASVLCPARHILVPRLDAEHDLVELEAIAVAFLRHFGLATEMHTDEAAARAAVEPALSRGAYPLLVTALDTSGEKPFEEFLGDGEHSVDIGRASVEAVPYLPGEPGRLDTFLERLEGLLSARSHASREEIIGWMSDAVPNFRHASSALDLDQRM